MGRSLASSWLPTLAAISGVLGSLAALIAGVAGDTAYGQTPPTATPPFAIPAQGSSGGRFMPPDQFTPVPGTASLAPGGVAWFIASAPSSEQAASSAAVVPPEVIVRDVSTQPANVTYDGEDLEIATTVGFTLHITSEVDTACTFVNQQQNVLSCHLTPGPTAKMVDFTAIPFGSQLPAGLEVGYRTGWNIVAGPADTIIAGADGPLYAYLAGDSDYQVTAPGAPLQAGVGYWAYFDSTVTEQLTVGSSAGISVSLPMAQYILIGDPFNGPAVVAGADAVFVFDPARKAYRQTTTLEAGQGAWAYSTTGGAAVISPVSP